MRALIWIGLAGCVAREIIVSTEDPPEDTAPPADTAVDDTDTDTGEAKEPEEPSYDLNRWEGVLHFEGEFFGNNCDEDVTESGVLLAEDDPIYNACASCNAIYRLSPSADAACSLGAGFEIALSQPTTRGVLFGDGFAMIYAIENGRSSLLDSSADFTDGRLTFAYTESIGGGTVEVTGAVRFREE